MAVKQLRQSLLDMDGGVSDEFDREIRFMRSIRNRNIVFFFGFGYHNQLPFLVRIRGVLANRDLAS